MNSRMATLSPPLVGSFNAGRGELFAQHTFQEKSILVRGAWSDITPDSHHYEESYSEDGGRTWMPAFVDDGGKTWETNWINKYTRVKPSERGARSKNPGPDSQKSIRLPQADADLTKTSSLPSEEVASQMTPGVALSKYQIPSHTRSLEF